MKKITLLLYVILSCVVFNTLAYCSKKVKERDLGTQTIIHKSSCFVDATFNIGQDYDMDDSFKYVSAKVINNSTIRFTLQFEKGITSNYIQIAFYHKNQDKKYDVYPDLTRETPHYITENSTGIFFILTSQKMNFVLYPIVYKRGFRGLDNNKNPLYFDPFDGDNTVTTFSNEKTGGHGNMLTYFLIKALGRGTEKIDPDKKSVISINKEKQYVFNVNFSKKLTDNNWYFIVSLVRTTIMTSGRGLRSSIVTPMLTLSNSCKK